MSFYYSRAYKQMTSSSKNYRIIPSHIYDYDEYGFYCDMEECEPDKTYAHSKYIVPPKNEAYYKKLSYDVLSERSDDHICNIQTIENYSDDPYKYIVNNEKLNALAQRMQIYMHIGVGCVFMVTSWILFREMIMN
jgi:hypothetical protein